MVTFGADTCSDKWLLVRDGASLQENSVWEICIEHAESAKSELWRGQSISIEYTNKAGSVEKWFQLDYTAVVDNFLPLPPATTTETRVTGDNDCGGRRLKADGDSELPNTAPEVQGNYVPTYRVTIKHDQRLFEGEPIPGYRASTGYGDRGNGILEIKKFNEQNEGQYTCLARAGNLTAEHVFSMTMVNDCNLEGFRGPSNDEGIVSNTVFLTCSVLHAKEVLWKKDGEVIDFEENTRMKHLSNNYLQISNLELEDEGDYSCEATDIENCGSEKTAHLTVFRLGAHSKYCGRSVYDQARESMATAYISKGDDTYPKEHPWHFTMLRADHNGRLQPFCGATLISQNYLITAAQCITYFPGGKEKFTPENVKLNFASTRCLISDVMKTFKRYIIHEDFNKTALFDSDIALIELDEPLEYSSSIRPVCLEDATYNNRRFLEGRRTSVSMGRVLGCGRQSSLRYDHFPFKIQSLYMPYVAMEDCINNINEAGQRSGVKIQLTNNMFCAGRLQRGVGDVCNGDNGGGLLMEAAGEFRWVLTGIVSFGIGGCDNPNYYSIFTNVGNFYKWINDHTHFTEEEVDISFLDEQEK